MIKQNFINYIPFPNGSPTPPLAITTPFGNTRLFVSSHISLLPSFVNYPKVRLLTTTPSYLASVTNTMYKKPFLSHSFAYIENLLNSKNRSPAEIQNDMEDYLFNGNNVYLQEGSERISFNFNSAASE